MASDRYTVRLTRHVEDDLKRLRRWRARVANQLLRLESDPFLGHTLSGSLKGVRSLQFSLPGGSVYRAVYVLVQEHHECVVFLIGPHENIYKRAERRLAAVIRSGELILAGTASDPTQD